MNLIWRFLYVVIFSRFQQKVDFFAESVISFRVLPTDIDILGHMNNGRYLSLMDLGRINYMIRCGIFSKLTAQNIYPVIASEMIRFKKSLDFLQKFSLKTKLLGWDDKFFYIAHRFVIGDELYAISVIKARFLIKGKGAISPLDMLTRVGLMNMTSPALPMWLIEWNESDQKFFEAINI